MVIFFFEFSNTFHVFFNSTLNATLRSSPLINVFFLSFLVQHPEILILAPDYKPFFTPVQSNK